MAEEKALKPIEQIKQIAADHNLMEYPTCYAEHGDESRVQDLFKARKLLKKIEEAKSIADVKKWFGVPAFKISPNFYLQNYHSGHNGDYRKTANAISGALFEIALCIIKNDSPDEDYPRGKTYQWLIPELQNEYSINGSDFIRENESSKDALKNLIIVRPKTNQKQCHFLMISEIKEVTQKSDRGIATNPYDKNRPLNSEEMQQIRSKNITIYNELRDLEEQKGTWLSPLTLEVLIFILEVTRSSGSSPDRGSFSLSGRFENAKEKNAHFKANVTDYVTYQTQFIQNSYDSTPLETAQLGACFNYFLMYLGTLPEDELAAFKKIKNISGTSVYEDLGKINAGECLSQASARIADFVVYAVSAERAGKFGRNLKSNYGYRVARSLQHLVRSPKPTSEASEEAYSEASLAFDPNRSSVTQENKQAKKEAKADGTKTVVSTEGLVSSSSSNLPQPRVEVITPPPQVSSSSSSDPQPGLAIPDKKDAKIVTGVSTSSPSGSPNQQKPNAGVVTSQPLQASASANPSEPQEKPVAPEAPFSWKRFGMLTVLSLGVYPVMYALNKLALGAIKVFFTLPKPMLQQAADWCLYKYDTTLGGHVSYSSWLLEKSYKLGQWICLGLKKLCEALETISLALLSPIETYKNIRQESRWKAYLFVFALVVAFAALFIFAAPALVGVSGLILGMQLSSIPAFGHLGSLFAGAIIQPLLALMGISVSGALAVEVATISSMVLASGIVTLLYNGVEQILPPSAPQKKQLAEGEEIAALPGDLDMSYKKLRNEGPEPGFNPLPTSKTQLVGTSSNFKYGSQDELQRPVGDKDSSSKDVVVEPVASTVR